MARYSSFAQPANWDIARLEGNIVSPDQPQDLFHVLRDYLTTSKMLLDIGTGNGNRLKAVGHLVHGVYALELDPVAAQKANETLMPLAYVVNAQSEALPFRDRSFDVVSCRQAPFNEEEIWRVLRPNGVFITQQADADDKQNIKSIFGREHILGKPAGELLHDIEARLESIGFQVRTERYSYTEVIMGMEALIYLLMTTPVIPDFDPVKDEAALVRLENELMSDGQLSTNASRFRIIAIKPRG